MFYLYVFVFNKSLQKPMPQIFPDCLAYFVINVQPLELNISQPKFESTSRKLNKFKCFPFEQPENVAEIQVVKYSIAYCILHIPFL